MGSLNSIPQQTIEFLNTKAAFYHAPWFIKEDPISIPHRFSRKEDIEISAFLTAIITWGQRKMILQKASLLMELMENNPHDFLINAGHQEFQKFNSFVYRTFNHVDCIYFLSTLRNIYRHHGGLEELFLIGYKTNQCIFDALVYFRQFFTSFSPMPRTGKHLANVEKGSAAKRFNMFLRWMVRPDEGVDFGIWKKIDPAHLMIPLDVHVARVARNLGILQRKQNDWKAVVELTQELKKIRPHDPVFYDYALFGSGVYEK
ncbi:TIGR02757 family protein [Natronoflexus pectinivorans]|uniref:Uncharacterized protein (TIGR02757 family) n=1 Tax=Natronoflexus pectinivorans TaxID=682526 RepID=A0A4R2GL18_9BACT|nr:TIGR02757 family protein [Natronoflexus pectinivorans]TCO09644.1 uncharacterized protein (TIGR02757 family) [Natronoflexus pectinivorans]